MRHAILILAHKNVDQLCRLVRYFDHDCDVYIHIDKKQPIATEEEERLRAYGQVRLVSRQYDVNWGGTSVLESGMYLLRVAASQSKADYFHLISGQDYPTRPLEYFLNFFEENVGKEFIGYLHLPHPNWENNTFRRLQYFYPYDYAAGQSNPRRWVREQVKAQQAKGEKRPIPDEFDHLYGSSQWFSITRKAVVTLLDYTDQQPRLYGRMWMTFAPEECYVAQWRSRGLSFAGYDANPYTEALSAMLLPEGDTPCGVADLTEDLETDCQFDLVVCKDVLPYIPQELERMAVHNLAKLSSRFILLSWNVPDGLSALPHRQVEEDALLLLESEGFTQERYMTGNLHVLLNRKDCCVLARCVN